MTGIVFTSKEEARPFLERYERGRFRNLEENSPEHDNRLVVALTGTGKIKATLRTERLLQHFQPERLVHVGTCTALSDDLEAGTWLAAAEVIEGDRIELSAPSYPRMPLETPFETEAKGTLVTQDHTLTNQEERSYWQRIADASDMTGYAVAYVAATHGTPCHIAKIITGHLQDEHDEAFQKRLQAAHKAIADFLLDDVLE